MDREGSDVIGLDIARQLVEAARRQATADGLEMSFAVVDAGGHPILMERMDGARILGGQTVINKALTAVYSRRATHLTVERSKIHPEVYMTLAAATEPRMVLSMGGYPLFAEGSMVGGFGSSGGTGEQDMAASQAAISRWAELGGDPDHPSYH